MHTCLRHHRNRFNPIQDYDRCPWRSPAPEAEGLDDLIKLEFFFSVTPNMFSDGLGCMIDTHVSVNLLGAMGRVRSKGVSCMAFEQGTLRRDAHVLNPLNSNSGRAYSRPELELT